MSGHAEEFRDAILRVLNDLDANRPTDSTTASHDFSPEEVKRIVRALHELTTRSLDATVDRRGDATRCPLHGEQLREDRVKIRYGLPSARAIEGRKRFPFAKMTVVEGCIMFGNEPTHAWVLYCEQCRSEWYIWEKGSTK